MHSSPMTSLLMIIENNKNHKLLIFDFIHLLIHSFITTFIINKL